MEGFYKYCVCLEGIDLNMPNLKCLYFRAKGNEKDFLYQEQLSRNARNVKSMADFGKQFQNETSNKNRPKICCKNVIILDTRKRIMDKNIKVKLSRTSETVEDFSPKLKSKFTHEQPLIEPKNSLEE